LLDLLVFLQILLILLLRNIRDIYRLLCNRLLGLILLLCLMIQPVLHC